MASRTHVRISPKLAAYIDERMAQAKSPQKILDALLTESQKQPQTNAPLLTRKDLQDEIDKLEARLKGGY